MQTGRQAGNTGLLGHNVEAQPQSLAFVGGSDPVKNHEISSAGSLAPKTRNDSNDLHRSRGAFSMVNHWVILNWFSASMNDTKIDQAALSESNSIVLPQVARINN